MPLRCRYRCEPTPRQCVALALSNQLYKEGEKYPGGAALMQRCITQAKRTPERSWLGNVSASMLQQSVRDLDKAFI
ncbi:MAG: transposase [Synechococcus sp. SB0662_bin_45]|nr:transposase [Synechococcus sp. SB0668_bin_13]MYE21824.1 transposase [Synechococcus sp. SB0662_bin_45]MYG64123.1 transposase [Synechococcus sp. SB0675_bin_7]MYK86696.1 transposase [Synechococcus sp. SB0669_bin_7]